MKTRKNVIIALTMTTIAAGTFSLGAGLAKADQGPKVADPIASCSGHDDDGDMFRDCPIESFAAPAETKADDGTIQLFGAGCPRAFTDFTGQRWCLFDVSPDSGAINTCSYNNC
jgi:hypothetical protein